MENNLEIQETLRELSKAFHFHGFAVSMQQDNASSDGYCFFQLPSGGRLLVVCRAVISLPTVEKYRALFAGQLKDGAELLFAAPSFSQSFVDSYVRARVHFFSLNGACRITLPGVMTYIVKIQTGGISRSRNSGGSPFVGKGAMLPRLFFSQPHRVWTSSELVEQGGMTRAYVSIILHRMLDNGYIRQESNGYQLVKPEKMLDDWFAVYRFNRYVRRQMYAASFETMGQGLQLVGEALQKRNISFGFMGASGAYLRAPYMESRIVMAYVAQIPDELPNLYPVENNGNVILYIPQNSGVFFGERVINGLPVVSDVQLYLDLKRMPGRNEDQADYLRDTCLNWSK